MMVSPPGSPDGVRLPRPQSMYSAPSPENQQKSRPQSMIHRPVRSNSRLSQHSKQGGESRASDEEGKTSVKVVIRVRPPLQPTDPGYDLIPQRFQRSMVRVNTSTSLGVDSPQGRKIFIFDHVFGEDIPQVGVWDYLQDSVDSFTQGYNVSILAYGQSGAGKSYTMGTSGPMEQSDPSSKGVIPRAAEHLFEYLHSTTSNTTRPNSGLRTPTRYSVGNINSILQNGNSHQTKASSDKKWELSVTYVEIYNEQPRDLLLPESVPTSERATVLIREDAKGRIYVEGLKAVTINTIEELLHILNHGSTIRQTDSTAINAKSSRSHAVFTLNLRQSRPQNTVTASRDKRNSVSYEATNTGESFVTLESKLHFVDLAGSERMKNTGAIGDRAREGISINAGLASLGKVISQLSSRAPGSHVSYRDSKLTRMLQDSLGGDAITYMIACVTPAEFHLSETLNTVQYAQRARNIQSKPKIQQVSDDTDKQAIIDRLKTEVAFLRQQIRSAETGDRRNGSERSDRPNEREVELQNRLLDIQESYTTLSQRHARLISEFGAAGQANALTNTAGESAIDRLKRSRANQEQIEQVVLEYEKTIQSLEANLSNTRSTLANTESSLLEKETKCAYVDTMNQQLHARVQKLTDREASTESYLRELEAQLEGQNSGSGKNDAIVAELRKEISRIRGNEANAEDYITTLEERLAEADQDMELMQRELERLGHLVERQRSLGKLDNLLYELDHIQKSNNSSEYEQESSNSVIKSTSVARTQDRDGTLETLTEGEEIQLPTRGNEQQKGEGLEPEKHIKRDGNNNDHEDPQQSLHANSTSNMALVQSRDLPQPNPAQSRFVAEKFETVTQELFDLRLEHESTMNELDLLSTKYQEALRTLAEMQETADESRYSTSEGAASPNLLLRPKSSSTEAKATEEKIPEHLLSSRSRSTELSMAGELHSSMDLSHITPPSKNLDSAQPASQEVERLQQLLAEHEQSMNDVTRQFVQLQTEHNATLKTIEVLKSEVIRNKNRDSLSVSPSMLRRTIWQTGNGVDRGQRSITSLRNMLAEEFEDRPDRMETIEAHLGAANNELQLRMERIQALEAETKSVKKDMEMKSTIISGLTRERERNSLKVSSPVDLSMVSQMRDQLIQKETELKSLHEAYASREQELQREVELLTAAKAKTEALAAADRDVVAEIEKELQDMTRRYDELSAKHRGTEHSAGNFQQELATAESELEAALTSVDTLHIQHGVGESSSLFDRAAAATAMQVEREKHQGLVGDLKTRTEELKANNSEKAEMIAEIEERYSAAQVLIDTQNKAVETRDAEIAKHLATISDLEKAHQDAQSAVEFHRHGLKSLHEAHAKEVEGLKLSQASAMAEIDGRLANLSKRHDDLVEAFKIDIEAAKGELQTVVAGVQTALGHPTTSALIVSHIQDLVEEKKQIADVNARLASVNAELERQISQKQSLNDLENQLAAANSKLTDHQSTVGNLANQVANHEENSRETEKTIQKHKNTIHTLELENRKKVDIIEQLEQQLNNSFDQHNKRVSLIQAQGSQALIEAQQRISLLEKEIDNRKSLAESDGANSRSNTMKSLHRPHSPSKDSQQRSSSLTSNLRKSASIASLPSPPPAIPLPPLPSMATGLCPAVNAANPSPPNSRHVSKELPPHTLPTNGNNPLTPTFPPPAYTNARQSALIEEQDARLRTIEKHLHAEKQLTTTLEEALVDLETQSNKLRADVEAWKKKAWAAEEEVGQLRKERRTERLSVLQVEDERMKRREAEAAREQLEERMRALNLGTGGVNGGKKKRKGGGLNCF